MATFSMLLLIIGAGGILLGMAWCLQSGIQAANIKPSGVGILLLSVGLLIPLEESAQSPLSTSTPDSKSYSSEGQESSGTTLPLSTTISSRLNVACKTGPNGAASCWGGAIPLPSEPVHKFALSREYGCALLQTGAIHCWGAARSDANRLAALRFIDIAATLETICGITKQGALHCFGADLGMPPPGLRWNQLVGGGRHMCALTEEGAAHCWGDNVHGQTAVPVVTPFTSLSAGHFHTCGLTDTGEAHCWGRNREQQAEVPDNLGFSQLSAGWGHTCALDASGIATCWGCGGRHAHLMMGAEDACSPPSEPFKTIAAGDLWRSCGVTTSGKTLCWGGLSRSGGPS